MRNDLDAWRKKVVVQLVYFFVDRVQRGIGIRAFAQQDDAFDDIVVIDHFAVRAMNRLADLAQADLRALRDRRDIAHADRRAVLRLDHGFSMSLNVLHQTDGAHVDLLQALLR